ncbi:MAG: cupin domain-containing protein [Bacteroidales bacterium]|jgi:cupin 2 domain-containing protein|nr:cupin domain-containing protein [Bacteroidales bacterium]
MYKNNIFEISEVIQRSEDEVFETLFYGNNIRVERIISTGQTTPEDQWYDQDTDEWVVLLQGEARLSFENEEDVFLKKGDYMLIQSRKKHKVSYTSTDPACIWLAIHGNINI